MLIDLKVWLDHFEYHARHRRVLPERGPDALAPDERRMIASSIATLQLGEQSEGQFLLRSARRYERALNAAPIGQIMQLFIAEEQHHAALLGTFMDSAWSARKRSDWTNHVFRCLRRLAGFQLHLTVLITAELIGKVYYRALEAATACRQLQALCHLLVADELAHVDSIRSAASHACTADPRGAYCCRSGASGISCRRLTGGVVHASPGAAGGRLPHAQLLPGLRRSVRLLSRAT